MSIRANKGIQDSPKGSSFKEPIAWDIKFCEDDSEIGAPNSPVSHNQSFSVSSSQSFLLTGEFGAPMKAMASTKLM